jgi:SAM-dependent methyltransferase
VPVISARGSDERAALLPPELLPLFDDAFITSWDLFEEYVARQVCAIVRSTGLEQAFERGATESEAIADAGLNAEAASVPVHWLAAMLIACGRMRRIDEGRKTYYRLVQPFTIAPPEEIAEAQARCDPNCLPAYAIVAMAAEQYPSVLRGEVSGEQALFGAEGISAWVKYFANANPLYAISNRVGAIAVEQSLRAGGAILELGGGLGSGAQALLERLQSSDRLPVRYQFTELSALFMKRAERVLARWRSQLELELTQLDIDRPFAEAGITPQSYAVVYGVNVVHIARDLGATLREIRGALAPGGALVISECVRAFADTPLPVELVFNLLESFRAPLLHPVWRPNGGFLTPEQWTAALQANGFGDVRVFPDIATIRDAYPSFAIAGIVARRD